MGWKGFAMTVKQSTIRYAAKEAYKLFVHRGLTKTTNCGLSCTYFYSETLEQAFILVDVNGKLTPVKVAKSWINS
jgi:hypothetical protein